MNIINDFRSYIMETEFQINILYNKINIINHSSIGHFDSNKVIVWNKTKEIIIKGNNLVVSKLMQGEVLIIGEIKNIEFR